MLHRKRHEYFLTELSSLGQEPTVNIGTKYYRTNSLHSAIGYLSDTEQLASEANRLVPDN